MALETWAQTLVWPHPSSVILCLVLSVKWGNNSFFTVMEREQVILSEFHPFREPTVCQLSSRCWGSPVTHTDKSQTL